MTLKEELPFMWKAYCPIVGGLTFVGLATLTPDPWIAFALSMLGWTMAVFPIFAWLTPMHDSWGGGP